MQRKKPDAMRDLFWPGGREGERRNSIFLTSLTLDQYEAVFKHFSGAKAILPDIARLAGLTKWRADILSHILRHVIAWVNPEPAKLARNNSNEKPALRLDLKPGLVGEDTADQIKQARERIQYEIAPLSQPAELNHTPCLDEDASLLLQQEVLDYALANLSILGSKEQRSLVTEVPDSEVLNQRAYTNRFQHHPVWHGILQIVRQYKGSMFRAEWCSGSEVEGSGKEDGTDTTEGKGGGAAVPLIESIRTHIRSKRPELTDNQTLQRWLDSTGFQDDFAEFLEKGCRKHRATQSELPAEPEESTPGAPGVSEPAGSTAASVQDGVESAGSRPPSPQMPIDSTAGQKDNSQARRGSLPAPQSPTPQPWHRNPDHVRKVVKKPRQQKLSHSFVASWEKALPTP